MSEPSVSVFLSDKLVMGVMDEIRKHGGLRENEPASPDYAKMKRRRHV